MPSSQRPKSTPRAGWRVRRARPGDLAQLAPLFDAYRRFYGQPPDLPRARRFLRERMRRRQSTLFVAETKSGELVGFAQLYPSFSSVSAAPIHVLNDLFVAPAARGGGVGRRLLAAAVAFARRQGAARLNLETHRDNLTAQHLYAAAGWRREHDYFCYAYDLLPASH
jgi:ribosomal protein S18 acetylase RimI-like enzyme